MEFEFVANFACSSAPASRRPERGVRGERKPTGILEVTGGRGMAEGDGGPGGNALAL